MLQGQVCISCLIHSESKENQMMVPICRVGNAVLSNEMAEPWISSKQFHFTTQIQLDTDTVLSRMFGPMREL
jgi:hypothetical protein